MAWSSFPRCLEEYALPQSSSRPASLSPSSSLSHYLTLSLSHTHVVSIQKCLSLPPSAIRSYPPLLSVMAHALWHSIIPQVSQLLSSLSNRTREVIFSPQCYTHGLFQTLHTDHDPWPVLPTQLSVASPFRLALSLSLYLSCCLNPGHGRSQR